MAQPANHAELAGSFPIFLLEVTWEGFTYRFSTYPMALEKADGTSVGFDGGLADPNLEERLESVATDIESDGIQIEVVFPVDLVKRMVVGGVTLDDAAAELSMALERDGEILTSYENRIRLFSGTISQPIIGDPDKPIGSAAFTIERNPLADPVPMIRASHRITRALFPDIGTAKNAIGKAWPIVIGQPGNNVLVPSNLAAGIEQKDGYATPAYIIDRDTTGSSINWPVRLMIAGHKVAASTVKVKDYLGNTATLNVQQAFVQTYSGTPEDAEVYSYVEFTFNADGLVHPFLVGSAYDYAKTERPEYWVSWTGGGALENPYGTGTLTKAGDVLRWALSHTRVDIDHQSWNNYAFLLNDFASFAGYINDPEVDAYSWLMDHVLPWLPIEVVNGPDGLRPVFPFVFAGGQPNPVRAEITVDVGFYIVGPITTESEPDEILNRVETRYGLVAPDNDPLAVYTISGEGTAETLDHFSSSDEICRLSRSRYGDRFQAVDLQYVYHLPTAAAVARWLTRRNAFTRRSLAFVADTSWGWLQVGDAVAITSESYYFSGHKFQIIAKSWADGSWNFTMEIENNPILNRRP